MLTIRRHFDESVLPMSPAASSMTESAGSISYSLPDLLRAIHRRQSNERAAVAVGEFTHESRESIAGRRPDYHRKANSVYSDSLGGVSALQHLNVHFDESVLTDVATR